jgi:biopolymer transport protein ExbB
MQQRKRKFWLWTVAAAFALSLIPSAANAWWKDEWSYRKQITLDTSGKGANIAQPGGRAALLIRLHSGNFQFADAMENGDDIRFIAADDKTPLPFHIESFDPLLGVATIWVDVSELPAGATRDIWLYYGNPKATPAADSKATFDADYALVYHFADAAGTAPKDATAYGNNATTLPGAPDQNAIVGKGARFAGTGALNVAATPSLEIKGGGTFSFEAWVKPDATQPQAAIFARREGASALIIGIAQGVPFVELRGASPARVNGTQAIANGQWSHIAVTAGAGVITLYINGSPVANAPGALPAFNSPLAIGGDVAAAGATPEFPSIVGSIDEVRLSRTARPAALIFANASSQGAESKLIAYGADEEQSGFGFGYFGIIIQSVTVDAWVVIAILGVMALISWLVMWNKWSYVGRVDKANESFLQLFRRHGGDPIALDEELGAGRSGRRAGRLGESSIFRVYRAGADEIERRNSGGARLSLNAEAIEVVRAVMDASLVRENQRLSRQMVLLTISISGGPFLGLLGTVVGVMITFAAIAASGDVNINAIAPGISAALLATVAGLGVAIPALFGYNYLLTRIKNIGADMQVFVDEFVTRTSENYGTGAAHPVVAARAVR